MTTCFEKKVWLSSPTMHGEEIRYVTEAYETNWMSTVGANINEVERLAAEKIGCKYAVALSAGTAALHLCTKLAGEALYGMPKVGEGALRGHKVFCSDMTFDATVNPIAYESGEAVFIDTEYDTWNMDPVALEKAFEIYPEVRLVVLVHLYGTPGKVDEIRTICKRHNALLIEDAAESFGATYKGVQTGKFGDYSAISFNGNKIITGSSGGMFLTDSLEDANKVRKWSTQSRERAPWYQHEELGYNYRMTDMQAALLSSQLDKLDIFAARRKDLVRRYDKAFNAMPEITVQKEIPESDTVRHLYIIQLNTEMLKCGRREVFDALQAEGVGVNVHYIPVYSFPYYQKLGYKMGSCPNAEKLYERIISIPLFYSMTNEDQDKVVEAVKKVINYYRK